MRPSLLITCSHPQPSFVLPFSSIHSSPFPLHNLVASTVHKLFASTVAAVFSPRLITCLPSTRQSKTRRSRRRNKTNGSKRLSTNKTSSRLRKTVRSSPNKGSDCQSKTKGSKRIRKTKGSSGKKACCMPRWRSRGTGPGASFPAHNLFAFAVSWSHFDSADADQCACMHRVPS